MILHTYYSSEKGERVYLESVDSSNVFYRMGGKLIIATIAFFESKYRLGF